MFIIAYAVFTNVKVWSTKYGLEWVNVSHLYLFWLMLSKHYTGRRYLFVIFIIAYAVFTSVILLLFLHYYIIY